MIVFNLSCSHGHDFDGWFRSAEDFERQSQSVLVECPLCGDTHIKIMTMGAGKVEYNHRLLNIRL